MERNFPIELVKETYDCSLRSSSLLWALGLFALMILG